MKEWVEKLRKECVQLAPFGYILAYRGLELIAEIESLETKIKELDIGLVARTLLKQENEKLQAVREAAEELLIFAAWFTKTTKDNPTVEKALIKLQRALAAK